MNLAGGFFKGYLILVQLSSALVLSSCTATPRGNLADTTATRQPTVPAKDTRSPLETGTRNSQQDGKISLKSLPRDHFNVDWGRAVKEGYINPKASINTDGKKEALLDLDVVLRFDDPLIKDVLFSHATHTYWLNCETCHPKIFVPRIAANKMTMQDIQEGRYCGRCHGIVAFPTNVMPGSHFRDYCLTCHNYRKR